MVYQQDILQHRQGRCNLSFVVQLADAFSATAENLYAYYYPFLPLRTPK